MTEKVISALVEGGKATAGPPLGPTLAPLGINISNVVAQINEKTKEFKSMQVPVKVIVETNDKTFKIEVGTPPTSGLIKKAMNAEKGSSKPKEEIIGEVSIDQIIQITRAKRSALHANTERAAVKEVAGSCISLGVYIDGKNPTKVQKEIDEGKYDAKIEGREPLKESSMEEIEERQKPYKDALANKKAAAEAAAQAAQAATATAEASTEGKAPAAGTEAPKKGETEKKEAKKPQAKGKG